METPVKQQIKQLWFQLFINACLALYAASMLLRALETHVAWRILIAATATFFFPYVLITNMVKIIKLRKADRAEL